MTITEAKATIYANVVYACEKAGLAPQTTRLVQDACDTIIALADACETIVALADRKTEPTISKMEQVERDCTGCKFIGTYDTEFPCVNCSRKTKDYYAKDEPQTCSVNGRPYDCGKCEYHKCTADEPQIIACPINERAEYWFYEDEPQVDGILFKGNLKEGDYKLIKTTDGWVLEGKDIVYCGWERGNE